MFMPALAVLSTGWIAVLSTHVPIYNCFFTVQFYLRGIAGSVPDHSNKMNITVKQIIHFFFGFQALIKVMFTVVYSMCNSIV